MKKAVFALLGVVLLSLSQIPALYAQDMMEEEEMDLAYGAVTQVSAQSITIIAYNEETDSETLQSFTIDADTIFDNFESISEIEKDAEVEILFVEVGTAKLARLISIYVEMPDIDDGMGMDMDMGQEDMMPEPVMDGQ